MRVWTRDGSRLTLRLRSMDEASLSAQFQAAGPVEIKRSALGRLEFNIYDEGLEHLRAPSTPWLR